MPRARNPQTGEIVEWDGNAWKPIDSEPVTEDDLQFEKNQQEGDYRKARLSSANFRGGTTLNQEMGDKPDVSLAVPLAAYGGIAATGALAEAPAVARTVGPAFQSIMRHVAPRFQPRTLGQLAKAAATGAGIEGVTGGDPKRGALEGLMIATIGGNAGPFMKFGLKRGVIDTVAGIEQKGARTLAKKAAAKVLEAAPKAAEAVEETVAEAAPKVAKLVPKAAEIASKLPPPKNSSEMLQRLGMLYHSDKASRDAVLAAAKQVWPDNWQEMMLKIKRGNSAMGGHY